MSLGINTKNIILMSAMKLFSSLGYENVSMRTIADDVGIKASSIYNHYSSKDEILNACYEFYEKHRYDIRCTKEQYISVLKEGSKEEVVALPNYPFREDIVIPIYQSFLIVFSRVYTDERAKKIYASEITNSLEYLEEFFKTGIELGRFEDFSYRTVSLIWLSTRLFTAQSLVLSPEELEKWSGVEIDVLQEIVKMIPFKY